MTKIKYTKIFTLIFLYFILTLSPLTSYAIEVNGVNLSVTSNSPIYIDGDLEVMRPIVGESMANYSLKFNNKLINEESIKFSLKDNYKGVSITEQGKLIVTPDVSVDKITIVANFNDSSASLDISLFDSFTASAIDTDGTPLAIPTTEQMEKVITPKYSLINLKVITIIKFSAVTILGLILFWYGFNYKKYKNTNK